MQKYSLKISFLLSFLIISNMSFAQKYNLAAGLRWGGDFGLSISERIAKRWTLEQNINSEDENNYYSAFAIAKYHQPIVTSRFNWFYGGGPGMVRVKETPEYKEATSLSLLIQTGLEFTIKRVNLYAALEPYFYNTNSGARFKMHEVFAVKYVIIKRKSKWKQKMNKRFKWKKKKKKNTDSDIPWWKFWEKKK
ncbi:MAG TPA: hypothetical protein ENI82_06485 [Bacteroidetes bacterium]|nr:hypothetical protein [Bacteroidota bacterium]